MKALALGLSHAGEVAEAAAAVEALQRQGRRPRRLRARRHRAEEFQAPGLVASARHASMGDIGAQVTDLSLHGLGLVLQRAAQSPTVVLPGDRLDALVLTHGSSVVYRGSGVVRRAVEAGADLVLGVELESGLDLGELYRQGTRRGFAERWHSARTHARAPRLAPEFKAWVADTRAYLLRIQEFLDAEEERLKAEDQLTREEALRQYLEEATPPVVADMQASCQDLGRLVAGLSPDAQATHRAYLKAQLAPFFLRAPFMRRALEKPLGYAGDYEMMNMIYRFGAGGLAGVEGETLFGRVLNAFALQLHAAQAVFHRLGYLGELIRATVATSGRKRARIASIGCGPANELAVLLTRSPELGKHLDVALVDQEERAMAFCERRLGPLAATTGLKCHFIRESVRRLLTSHELGAALGQRDLIYSAGLFDYFSDRSFAALLEALYGALAPGGRLAVGNFSDANPSQWAMEYFAEWFLNHRSNEQLRALATGLQPVPTSVAVGAESLDVNLFLLVTR